MVITPVLDLQRIALIRTVHLRRRSLTRDVQQREVQVVTGVKAMEAVAMRTSALATPAVILYTQIAVTAFMAYRWTRVHQQRQIGSLPTQRTNNIRDTECTIPNTQTNKSSLTNSMREIYLP